MNLEVIETYVIIKPDNYPTGGSGDVLDAFGDSLATRTFSANLAHLISLKSTGLGGIAYLDVICDNANNYGFSNADFVFAGLPVYSWTIGVIAHELGHNFGSNHTQWCGWEVTPGNFYVLDSCYDSEGGCYPGPYQGRIGTLMSYCHLNGSIDLRQGFGPLPRALVQERVSSASCLTPGNFIYGVSVPGSDTVCLGQNVAVEPTNQTGVTYAWTGPNNFTSSARILSINNIQSSQIGTYYLTLTKDNCPGAPVPVSLKVDCIPTFELSKTLACQSDLLTVKYIANFVPAASNQFTVELSNANGSFATPTVVGSLASAALKGTISFSIPAATLVGTGYKVRVKSSSPSQTGQASALPLAINARLPNPTVTNGSRAGTGSVALQASSPGNTLIWYANAVGGAKIGIGSPFNTPSITATTTYYVEAGAGTTSTVGVPSKATYSGRYTTAFSSGLYFAAATKLSIDSITVYPRDPGILVINVLRQSDNSVVISRSFNVTGNINGEKIPLLASIEAGAYIINGNGSTCGGLWRSNGAIAFPFSVAGLISLDYSTSGPSPTGLYFFFYNWKVSKFGCTSARVPVVATVTNNCTPPPAPACSSIARCGPGSVALSPTGLVAGLTYKWYATATSPNAVSTTTAAIYNTASVSASTTVYLSLASTTAANCESARVPVNITVNALPTVTTNLAPSRCGTGSLVLTATSSLPNSTFIWEGSTGTVLATGPATFTTTSLQTNSVFKVKAKSSAGCESVSATINATVLALPATPIAPNVARCGPGSISITATGVSAPNQYKFYADSSGGTALASNTTGLYTLVANQSSNLFVSAASSACESPRVGVTISVKPIPSQPTITRTGDSLVSSNLVGNQWYFQNTLLPGATSNYLAIAGRPLGTYSVQSTVQACSSAVSPPFLLTSNKNIVKNSITILPNPFNAQIAIASGQAISQVRVLDMLGKEIYRSKATALEIKISTNSWPKGAYLFAISTKAGTIVRKVVKD